ncbi:MAG TPA: STAS domain-containing protein [Leptospiraceae bacterium]|nr:STAS domain-containing protein [Leptospiraceae bacterium]HMY31960.1 STAS domain-containing protein [Leptospiraceae bacterium]HMZ63176.1 STAS domain-containing protein [Leptospiraceae bacterium]HNA07663.1 STAS domain-containing protein [Leptospiraceae bacterium]HNB97578.1 STAS domain-containing protein [Leptospiraceae bacterium]
MNVTIRENQSIPVIDIQGEITMYDIEPISEAINKLIQQKKYKVVFNMAEVPFIDSSGVGIILRSLVSLYKFGGIIHLCSCVTAVDNIIKVSVKNTTTKIFATEEEAVKACLN